MCYIVLDLEFNRHPETLQNFELLGRKYPYEIIQIGAIKMDQSFLTLSSFDSLVKPTFYSKIDPFIHELTGISTNHLDEAKPFMEVYQDFLDFIGSAKENTVFIVWGMSDMKELFRNASYHNLDTKLLPRKYINLQPYVSLHLKYPKNKPLSLRYSLEQLGISMNIPFHSAINDAFYTGEIFKLIYNKDMHPKNYDPSNAFKTLRGRKQVIDFDSLIKQFEKMYERSLSDEEVSMIKLAYKMGRTNQFVEFLPLPDNTKN